MNQALQLPHWRLTQRVLHEIAPEVDLERLDPGTELRSELDLDSMDYLNLVAGIHQRIGVDIPERDYSQLGTLGGFVAYLTSRAASGVA